MSDTKTQLAAARANLEAAKAECDLKLKPLRAEVQRLLMKDKRESERAASAQARTEAMLARGEIFSDDPAWIARGALPIDWSRPGGMKQIIYAPNSPYLQPAQQPVPQIAAKAPSVQSYDDEEGADEETLRAYREYMAQQGCADEN